MDDIQKYFDLLGLSLNASIDEAKQAYRDQINVWHPDRFHNNPRLQTKATEKLKEINEAYEKICEYISSPKHTTPPNEEPHSYTYNPGTNHKKETQSNAEPTYTEPIYKSNGKRDIKAEILSGAMSALKRPWYYYPLLFIFAMIVKSIFGIGKHEPKTPTPEPVSATYYNKAIQEQQAQQQLNQTQYTPLPQPINQSPEREYKSAPSQPEFNDSQRTENAQIPEETDPEVLFKLGRKHYRGDGVPKNETKAILYYKKAAKLGHAESAEFLKVLGVSIPQRQSQQNSFDTSNFSSEEKSSLSLACIGAKSEGPAAYNQCINQQLSARGSIGTPDTSNLSSDERSSLSLACIGAKSEGPAAYNRCVSQQMSARGSSGTPDTSSLSSDERSSLSLACIGAKSEGPAAYNRCVRQQLSAMGR